MNKRQFMLGAISTPFYGTSQRARAANSIKRSRMEFKWHHSDNHFHGQLCSTSNGWIAVGFNDNSTLENMRFIIADVTSQPPRIEEHLAIVPQHQEIGQLGLKSTITKADGEFRNGTSCLTFSLTQNFPGRCNLSLRPGSIVYVMLAWSHESNFEHHSAWRQHFKTTI